MRGKLTLLAGVCAGAIAFPAYAQDTTAATAAADTTDSTDIIVTAQRTSQRLQDVPIAVSVFNSQALEKQQIKNTSDLQLTLPNVTFTKTNFASSSFTIRGIGDLCVGVTCDSATAIHMNDAPLFGTPLFEGEFYDLAAIEVLRGPQGTLFGRNATSGVVNVKSARPDLTRMSASAEVEYGNFNGMKVKGMLNVPISDKVGMRVAGYYLKRDGYTKNLFDNSRIDDRDQYGIRGSLRFEPSASTTINLMVQYFHEKDHRLRIQKQLCQRDSTGILGCLNATRDFSTTGSTGTSILASSEFFAALGVPLALRGLALGSVNDTKAGLDPYRTAVNPPDYRTVSTSFTPYYATDELILQGNIEQDLGAGLDLRVQGNYQNGKIDSGVDYNLSVLDRSSYAGGLNTLAFLASGAAGPGLAAYLGPIAKALIPNGPNGPLCVSQPEETGTGVYSGHSICAQSPLNFDRSSGKQQSWSSEAVLSSKWAGPFNLLVGGIYAKVITKNGDYYINNFGFDYASGIIGAITAAGAGIPPTSTSSYFLASPYYRNNTQRFTLNSYGIFGEVYYKFNDKLKLTLGARYNHDEKSVKARTTFLQDAVGGVVIVPTGAGSITNALGYANLDFDPTKAGNQEFAVNSAKFSAVTGRAVLDYNITPNNLVYASFSRGYKSGGINPPLSASFAVTPAFKPEFVTSFEIGSKNTFGKIQLNLTGFYYNYKDLQLSRIVARTSVNDNVSAHIYGLEAEAVLRPTRELTINANASYLHTEVSQNKFLSNPRDFGGGRADAVIIKDITTAANCAVSSNTGSAAQANAFVNQVTSILNTALQISLPNTQSFGPNSGIASTGAFGICSTLQSLAPTLGASYGGITFGTAGTASNPVGSPGIDVNIKGNKLPGAPDYKFSTGIQYAAHVGDLTVTPRADFIYTGKSTGNIFNGPINAVPSFTQVNAQLQIDGASDKWFVRAWIQNVFDNNSITGLYVTDQSSGNFTNIFTLEPRRYGLTAGIKF